MKASLLSLAATILVLTLNNSATAQYVQWEQMGGPDGGSATSLARTPDGTIFAALDGQGLFRSRDDGASWQRIGARQGFRWTGSISATSRGTVLLLGSDSILQRSTDGGASWTIVTDRLNWSAAIVQDSSGGLIGAGYGEILRSIDDGSTWNRIGAPMEQRISALAVGSDGRIVAAVQSSLTERGIRISTDMGASWRLVEIGDSTTPSVLSLAATVDGALYAGTGGGGLFRSNDGGTTWSLLPLARHFFYSALLAMPDGSIVTGAGNDGIYRSSDNGASWLPVGARDGSPQVVALAATNDGEILAGTLYSGIYIVDGGRLAHSSRGLQRLGVWQIAIAPDGMIHTIATDGRHYSSSDNGAVWRESDLRNGGNTVIAVDHDSRLYIGNLDSRGFGILMSADRGASWTTPKQGLENEQVRALLVNRHNHLYAGVERGGYSFHSSPTDGLFHSTDHGETWSTLGTGLVGVSPVSIVELSDGTLFIGAQYGKRVLRLVPGDTLWRETSTGLPAYRYPLMLNALVADSRENLYAAMNQGLFRSSDRGASWQNIGGGLGDTMIMALAVSSDGRVFAATRSAGIYASHNNGESWRHLGSPSGATEPHLLAIDSSGALIAGGWDGMFRARITSRVPIPGRAIDAELNATPNPAGSRISIGFDMAVSGNARLLLYNALGQEIAVLLADEMRKGRHAIDLDCSPYPAGTYHLRLETEAGSQKIGLVVVK